MSASSKTPSEPALKPNDLEAHFMPFTPQRSFKRKPRMLVTVAQANKTARIVWAVLTKEEDYRAPVARAA